MRNLLFYASALSFSTCMSQDNLNIKLIYVNFDIMTIIGVDCDKYDILFNSEIKTSVITNKTDIDAIVLALNKLKADTSNRTLDVRGKLEIKSFGKSQIYCLSNMGISHYNTTYILPNHLIKLLKKYMK